jgi:hypothetical protein
MQTSRFEQVLWPRGERSDIWMIVDFARDRQIFPMLLAMSLEYSCLYSGNLPPALAMTAPYLIKLEFDQRETRRLLKASWGNSWGIFLKCDNNLKALRRHLREFLLVRGPGGDTLVFRYYDPRVLRVYLPTCYPDELRQVFGPIESFWMEDANADTLLQFTLDKQKLVTNAISLSTPGLEQITSSEKR